MNFSTRARYGLRAMLEIARQRSDKKILVREISKAQGISVKYLERLLSTLKQDGLVKASRGTGGGYSLAKPSSEIRLLQIIKALEGPFSPVECIDSPELCKRSATCAVRDIWKSIKEAVEGVLGSVTLEQLAARQSLKYKVAQDLYQI